MYRALLALALGLLGVWFQANAAIIHGRMGDRILISQGGTGGAGARWITAPPPAKWTIDAGVGLTRSSQVRATIGQVAGDFVVTNALPIASIVAAAKQISPILLPLGIGLVASAGLDAVEYLLDDLVIENGQIKKRVDPENPNVVSTGYEWIGSYSSSVCRGRDVAFVLQCSLESQHGAPGQFSDCRLDSDGGVGGSSYGSCYYSGGWRLGSAITKAVDSSCPSGNYIWSDGSCSSLPENQPEWRTATKQEIDDWFDRFVNTPGAPLDDLMDGIEKAGAPYDLPAPTVTGPSQLKEPAKKVTRPDGGTTTTQNTWNITVNGDKIDARRTTTITVRNENGDVISTETEESEDPEDYVPPDISNPDLPKLYERKYPDGMVGVWDTFKDRFTGSSLVSVATGLMPNIGDGGTCPSWTLDLDLGLWDFGSRDVAPPCWLWDVAKAILILSALLLARSLIFGG